MLDARTIAALASESHGSGPDAGDVKACLRARNAGNQQRYGKSSRNSHLR